MSTTRREATTDRIGGIASALFEVPLRFVIAVALILGAQAALIGRPGALETLWHGILEFLRLRPANLPGLRTGLR